jgi:hypothetical protein
LDLIHVNREFGLNEIGKSDSQFEKYDEPTRLTRLASGVQIILSNSSPGSALPLLALRFDHHSSSESRAERILKSARCLTSQSCAPGLCYSVESEIEKELD